MELKDIDIVNLTLAGTIVVLLIVGFFAVFVLLYTRRQAEYENEKLRAECEFSQELLRIRNEQGEEVPGKLSDEIHDNIGQTLTLAILRPGGLNAENFKSATEDAGNLISRSLGDFRDLSKSLSCDFRMRNGFFETLKQEVAFVERSGMFSYLLSGVYPKGILPADSELILYSCVQEAMGNALKHSETTDLIVELKKSDSTFTINVIDNGKGIPDHRPATGLGMNNMWRRMNLLGGQFDILPAKTGRGTSISLKLPLLINTSNE